MARLVGAAKQLRLGDLDPDRVRRALHELARAAFGAGEGIVRLQVSRDGEGALHLVGTVRPLGPDPAEWSAVRFRLAHPGGAGGLKVTSRLTLALAAEAAAEAGVDEALLLDEAGRVVEGARSNVVVVPAEGPPATPPLASGAVGGIARTLALERLPGLEEREIADAELAGAREIVALNAVRGARPVVRLDGRPVADGAPGPLSARLAAALADE